MKSLLHEITSSSLSLTNEALALEAEKIVLVHKQQRDSDMESHKRAVYTSIIILYVTLIPIRLAKCILY